MIAGGGKDEIFLQVKITVIFFMYDMKTQKVYLLLPIPNLRGSFAVYVDKPFFFQIPSTLRGTWSHPVRMSKTTG